MPESPRSIFERSSVKSADPAAIPAAPAPASAPALPGPPHKGAPAGKLPHPAEQEVFNGQESRIVPWCCDGEVIQVSSYQALAHRYMVEAQVLIGRDFICAKCKRELPSRPKPPPPPRKIK